MMTSTNAVLDTMWNGMDSNGFSGWITFNLLDEWPGHQRGNKFQRDPWWKKSFFYRQTEIHCMTIAYICIYILYFIYLYVCIHLCMYHYIYTYIHTQVWCQMMSDMYVICTWTKQRYCQPIPVYFRQTYFGYMDVWRCQPGVYPNHEWYTVS